MASADLPSAASITSHVASINLIERNGKTTRSVKKMKLKGTVVLTSVSLMGQWYVVRNYWCLPTWYLVNEI